LKAIHNKDYSVVKTSKVGRKILAFLLNIKELSHKTTYLFFYERTKRITKLKENYLLRRVTIEWVGGVTASYISNF
jgi:hypothetical protein